jgi:hypothetical protein
MGYPTSPNRESRHGTKIDSIVLHSTWGGFQGSVSWLSSTKSQASAHYIIGRDGQIANMVPEEDAAWHVRRNATGQVFPYWNARSIGIELVDDQMSEGWLTEEQGRKLILLVGQIIRRWDIPLNRDRIKMHYEIDAKSDPHGWTNDTMERFLSDVHNYLYPIIEGDMDEGTFLKHWVPFVRDERRRSSKLLGAYVGKTGNGDEVGMFDKDGRIVKVYASETQYNDDGWKSWEDVQLGKNWKL